MVRSFPSLPLIVLVVAFMYTRLHHSSPCRPSPAARNARMTCPTPAASSRCFVTFLTEVSLARVATLCPPPGLPLQQGNRQKGEKPPLVVIAKRQFTYADAVKNTKVAVKNTKVAPGKGKHKGSSLANDGLSKRDKRVDIVPRLASTLSIATMSVGVMTRPSPRRRRHRPVPVPRLASTLLIATMLVGVTTRPSPRHCTKACVDFVDSDDVGRRDDATKSKTI